MQPQPYISPENMANSSDVLYLTPTKAKAYEKIYLTASQSAWLTIEWLSDALIKQAEQQYSQLFDLRPDERGKVIVHGEELDSSRWHRSYLHLPARGENIESSYMYSGEEGYKDLTLPVHFQPFINFMNAAQSGDQYNQIIANWYANGQDFTAAHCDCERGMKAGAGIAILSLYAPNSSPRLLVFSSKKIKNVANDNIYQQIKISLTQGSIITMHGDCQQKFRHKVPKDMALQDSRLSLTFRKF